MSWGNEDIEDEPGTEAEPLDVDNTDTNELEEREPGRVFGVSISELARSLAGPAVEKAVRGAVQKAVDAEIAQAVVDALDPSVVVELHAQAATAARHEVTAVIAQLDDAAEEEPALYFGSVDEFVRGFLLPNYRRRVDGGNKAAWARDWWRYPEVVSRLDALWRAWEHLRLDPQTGMSVWYRDHAEHHMSILLSPSGP
ncbi:DUF4913 domain-containing protein, partial [Microbacterium sp. SSW1-59]|uniref:DUF4913 domain-containing protein n=1 Tax=Microbacterium xanthum TaxID=3079794 RepID=UPI002AD351E8